MAIRRKTNRDDHEYFNHGFDPTERFEDQQFEFEKRMTERYDPSEPGDDDHEYPLDQEEETK